jgi:hypothetical protein
MEVSTPVHLFPRIWTSKQEFSYGFVRGHQSKSFPMVLSADIKARAFLQFRPRTSKQELSYSFVCGHQSKSFPIVLSAIFIQARHLEINVKMNSPL